MDGERIHSQTGSAAGYRTVRRPGALPAIPASRQTEGHPFMLHVTCDLCGKVLRPGDDQHFVVKVEVFATQDPAEITEADLDDDHMEAVSELLREMEDSLVEGDGLDEVIQHFRYDLCPQCRKKFARDPLGKDAAQKFDF